MIFKKYEILVFDCSGILVVGHYMKTDGELIEITVIKSEYTKLNETGKIIQLNKSLLRL